MLAFIFFVILDDAQFEKSDDLCCSCHRFVICSQRPKVSRSKPKKIINLFSLAENFYFHLASEYKSEIDIHILINSSIFDSF